MSSGDDFETASDDDLINEVEMELNDGKAIGNGTTFVTEIPSAYIPDVPETRGLLTEGKC